MAFAVAAGAPSNILLPPFAAGTMIPPYQPQPQTQEEEDDVERKSLTQVDLEYQQIGCLGHGGFGSVFLAQKRSGRRVALKFMTSPNIDEEPDLESFSRELDAVLKLDDSTTDHAPTDSRKNLGIIFFEDWFRGPNFCCIVMNYADGGTLAQEIVAHAGQPYSERRIAWYALQLADALAYAHERGVAHHDVKSANVLIDRSNGGGKLLLADFGSAVAPGEESVGFAEIYASPELLEAHRNENYTGLQADKIDSFGLGCIVYELLCAKKLVDLTSADQTLAEFIVQHQSVAAALDLQCLSLPWQSAEFEAPPAVGYSLAMKGLVATLLEPNPSSRWTPVQLQKPLREDPLSPLLCDFVSAAQTPLPGAPLTLDNIQLGMFVQRGRDWDEGDSDGGEESVGVVVRLDPDGGYTEVVFPSRRPRQATATTSLKTLCCRIGAKNKFELQVGPMPLYDFFVESGVVDNVNVSEFTVGQLIHDNCMVVGVLPEPKNRIFIAPMERIPVPSLPFTLNTDPVPVNQTQPRKLLPPPDTWTSTSARLLVEVTDLDEKQKVLKPFYASEGGLDIQTHKIVSIKRVQCPTWWAKYAERRDQVAMENWGVANEQRLFHGTGRYCPDHILGQIPATSTSDDFYRACFHLLGVRSNEIRFSSQAFYGHTHRFQQRSKCQMILSRVVLGRTDDHISDSNNLFPVLPRPAHEVTYHSTHTSIPLEHSSRIRNEKSRVYTIQNEYQVFPEYVITYRFTPPPVVVGQPVRGQPVRIPNHSSTSAVLNSQSPVQPQNAARRPQELPSTQPTSANSQAPRQTQGTANRHPSGPARSSGNHRTEASATGRPSRTVPSAEPSRSLANSAQVPRQTQSAVFGGQGRPTTSSSNREAGASTSSLTGTVPSVEPEPPPGTKMCVVCLERAVSHILVPCGHPSLCGVCATLQGIRSLRGKCPECRTKICSVVRFFGRVVEN